MKRYRGWGSFTFPLGIRTPSEANTSVLREITALTVKLYGEVCAELDAAGFLTPKLDFRLLWVLEEITKNAFYYDMLGLAAEDVENIWDAALEDPAKLPQVVPYLESAGGRTSVVSVEWIDDVISISITLSRDFESFDERWHKAKTTTPGDDELQLTHNRGIFVIAHICTDGSYCPKSRTLTFTIKVGPAPQDAAA